MWGLHPNLAHILGFGLGIFPQNLLPSICMGVYAQRTLGCREERARDPKGPWVKLGVQLAAPCCCYSVDGCYGFSGSFIQATAVVLEGRGWMMGVESDKCGFRQGLSTDPCSSSGLARGHISDISCRSYPLAGNPLSGALGTEEEAVALVAFPQFVSCGRF